MPGNSSTSPQRYIDPVSTLGGLLLKAEKPARYAGGEFGILADTHKIKKADFRTLIAFPDLYEIGMANMALRIIYNSLNAVQGIVCDRAFAPAPDFEKILRETNIPLYGLDTGLVLSCFDLLMFTLGYELGLNGVLLMLDISQIPLRCSQRNEEHPVIIAGGPAVSNPLPYSPFIDAFWIGEAEAGFFDLAADLAQLKKEGQGRAAILEKISTHPNIWVKGKEKTIRAIYSGFSSESIYNYIFPIPSMKIAQHHGTVEIMRGCPNGCRFCHAGYWYRPMRQKSKKLIIKQVKEIVTKGGWQEISLSSLSSGDYCGIVELVEELNSMFSKQHISFQMPSLKVSGFSLDLLEKISVTRKSGLTFAIETPADAWQMAINKEVSRNSVVTILDEAKKRGWKSAKFYFMIGLPKPEQAVSEPFNEEKEIVDFITDIGRKTRMHLNVNVGIFIPKPHTPYQWTPQLDAAEAEEKLFFIRSMLKPMGHKVSISDSLISQIEGILSRGDERAGLLCEEAYKGGSRLDAWSEFINREKWQNLLETNRDLISGFLNGKERQPWEIIDSCTTTEYLKSELKKSNNSQRTLACTGKCNLCGVCGADTGIVENKDFVVNQCINKVNEVKLLAKTPDPVIYRLLFSFSKKGSAVFHGHLSLIEIFSISLRRAGICVKYTQGFNPLVKMEFASPLSMGISADCELASADFDERIDTGSFVKTLNEFLPQGLCIEKADIFCIKSGMKKYSLSSLLWGFEYTGVNNQIDYVNAKQEKVYRQGRLENDCGSILSLRRNAVLAQDKAGGAAEWTSYFDVYRYLYPAS